MSDNEAVREALQKVRDDIYAITDRTMSVKLSEAVEGDAAAAAVAMACRITVDAALREPTP